MKPPAGTKVHGNTKWTEEETAELGKLNEKFRGSKSINRDISLLLQSKTIKQISDKRRRLGARRTTAAERG
jgi:hypothetical protein